MLLGLFMCYIYMVIGSLLCYIVTWGDTKPSRVERMAQMYNSLKVPYLGFLAIKKHFYK